MAEPGMGVGGRERPSKRAYHSSGIHANTVIASPAVLVRFGFPVDSFTPLTYYSNRYDTYSTVTFFGLCSGAYSGNDIANNPVPFDALMLVINSPVNMFILE